MQDWLSARALATPDKIALITNPAPHVTDQLTFRHLDQQVTQMALRWQNAGIKQGDHVGMVIPPFPLSVIQIFTAMRMGVLFVPINTRLTVTEMSQQLTQSDCRWLLPYGDAETLRELKIAGHKIANLDAKITKGTSPLHPHSIDLNAPFAIIHTSGTSGIPKGAMLTYGNFFYSAMGSAYRLGTLPDDRWLCALPLFHVGGLSIILRACLYGISVDLLERFDLETINRKLSEEPITLISLVPTMLYRLLEHGTPKKWTRLRMVLLGGAAGTPELLEKAKLAGVNVATTYGMTEATSQVATLLPDEVLRKPASVGKPLMFTQVCVLDEHGNDQNAGEFGEIIVQGETVMRGYYDQPEATAKVLHDGWLHTGDIGYFDSAGDLFIVQRRTDLIITGGENVYPAEVEAVLRTHPAIKEVSVVGVQDAEWGQRVAAAIILHEGQSSTSEDIEAFSREHLAGYKIPRIIKFVEELPQTASGKIERKRVVELFQS
ncbi:MAG: o-succinylbenzoate--CoA ligase [Aggregatilineales bacterium]